MKYFRAIIITAIIFLYAPPVWAVSLINPLDPENKAGTDAAVAQAALDPATIIGNIIKGLLGVVGSLSLLVFIIGGAKIVFSIGDYKKVQEGRDTMIYAAVGLIIIFASYTLVNFAITKLVGAPVTP